MRYVRLWGNEKGNHGVFHCGSSHETWLWALVVLSDWQSIDRSAPGRPTVAVPADPSSSRPSTSALLIALGMSLHAERDSFFYRHAAPEALGTKPAPPTAKARRTFVSVRTSRNTPAILLMIGLIWTLVRKRADPRSTAARQHGPAG